MQVNKVMNTQTNPSFGMNIMLNGKTPSAIKKVVGKSHYPEIRDFIVDLNKPKNLATRLDNAMEFFGIRKMLKSAPAKEECVDFFDKGRIRMEIKKTDSNVKVDLFDKDAVLDLKLQAYAESSNPNPVEALKEAISEAMDYYSRTKITDWQYN